MSLSASRNLVPLAYNCQSGMARRAHGSESSQSPTPDEQITAQVEAKPLSIISPRRRREQEIDELEAEHRAEVLAKDDGAEETRTDQADNVVMITPVTDSDVESKKDERDTVIATNNEREHDDPTAEGNASVQQDEMREMAHTTILTVQEEDEGRSVESIEEQNEKEASESREQFDEPVEDEAEEMVEDEMPTTNSIGYIPALLSKVFDENGYLHCC